jgi:hypothetical protein
MNGTWSVLMPYPAARGFRSLHPARLAMASDFCDAPYGDNRNSDLHVMKVSRKILCFYVAGFADFRICAVNRPSMFGLS